MILDRMQRGKQLHPRADQHVITDNDRGVIHEEHVTVDERGNTHTNLWPIAALKSRQHDRPGTKRAEQPSQDLPPFLIILGPGRVEPVQRPPTPPPIRKQPRPILIPLTPHHAISGHKVILPVRYKRLTSASANMSPPAWNLTVAGSSKGSLKPTSTANASANRPSNAARQRAFDHIPCAIAHGNPNSRAVKGCRWIGLWSPDTAAYRRPISRGTSQTATEAGSSTGSRGAFSDFPARRHKYVLRSSQTTAPAEITSLTTSNCVPFGCGRASSARTRRSSSSPTSNGRCCTIRLATCTTPITG